MLPVYATRPAPPNGPVPVYAMPQPAPQASMEPQVSEPDSAPGATPAEAPQMVEPRPAEPEVFSRQRSQSGLSVEILQELGNNARLEIQKMENTDTEKNLKEQRVSFEDSFELGDFADIRNADGSIGVPLAPGQSRVML